MAEEKKQQDSSKNQIKVVVVDDHPIVRQGLSELISQEQDLVVCGQAEDADEAMALLRSNPPDMAIVDIALKESSGMELIKDIRAAYPNILILALSMHDESLYAERALRAVARGYIMKSEATDKVVDALHKIMAGKIYVSEKMAAKIMHKLVGSPDVSESAIDRLSDRELEVFSLIGQGYGTRQIAARLHLSIKTIETYRAHLKEKLNLEDGSELLQNAIRWSNSRSEEQI